MLIISEHEQRTPKWFADRLGKATGSNASAILAKGKTKGSESTTRRNYRFQLALERITNQSNESDFTNSHMQRGIEVEPFARMAYEVMTGNMIEEAGFSWEENTMYGCSVDGFVENRKGIVEIKCPIPAIHYKYIEDYKVPDDYLPQIWHNIHTTGAEFCDFISYNENMPEKLKLFVFRYTPTFEEMDAYTKALKTFLDEVDTLTKQILQKAE